MKYFKTTLAYLLHSYSSNLGKRKMSSFEQKKFNWDICDRLKHFHDKLGQQRSFDLNFDPSMIAIVNQQNNLKEFHILNYIKLSQKDIKRRKRKNKGIYSSLGPRILCAHHYLLFAKLKRFFCFLPFLYHVNCVHKDTVFLTNFHIEDN